MKNSLVAIFLLINFQILVAQSSSPSDADFEINLEDLEEKSGDGKYSQNNSKSLGTLINKHWKLLSYEDNIDYIEFIWFGGSKKIEGQALDALNEDNYLKFSLNDTIVYDINDTKLIDGLPTSFELIIKKELKAPKSFKYQFIDGSSELEKTKYHSFNPYYDALRLRYEPFSATRSILESYGTLSELASNPFFNKSLKDSINLFISLQGALDSLVEKRNELDSSFINGDFDSYTSSYHIGIKAILDSLYSLNKAEHLIDSLKGRKKELCENLSELNLLFIKSSDQIDFFLQDSTLQKTIQSIPDTLFKLEYSKFIESLKGKVDISSKPDTLLQKEFKSFYKLVAEKLIRIDSAFEEKDYNKLVVEINSCSLPQHQTVFNLTK